MGVTKSAGDAVELVKALGGNDDIITALKACELPRVAFGEVIVEHARALGAYMRVGNLHQC